MDTDTSLPGTTARDKADANGKADNTCPTRTKRRTDFNERYTWETCRFRTGL